MKTSKWRIKACTRCHGDLYIDRDINGRYEKCLQCGYSRELKDIFEFNRDKKVAN